MLLKDWLTICHFAGDFFLANLTIDIKFRPNKSNTATLLAPLISPNNFKKNTLSPNVCAYKEFIAIAINNKSNYNIVAMAKKKKIMANFVWETMKLLYYENFASHKFWLNTLHAFSFLLKIANAIGTWYGRLSLWTKIKFHIN